MFVCWGGVRDPDFGVAWCYVPFETLFIKIDVCIAHKDHQYFLKIVFGTLLYSFLESFIGMTRDYVCRINCETTFQICKKNLQNLNLMC